MQQEFQIFKEKDKKGNKIKKKQEQPVGPIGAKKFTQKNKRKRKKTKSE